MTTTSSTSATTAPPHKNQHHLFSTAPRCTSSRRSNNPSFFFSSPSNSLMSSPSSSDHSASPPPTSHPSSTHKHKKVGIPFSWEDLPGIPKKQSHLLLKRPDTHTRYNIPNSTSTRTPDHLPLPPAGRGGERIGGDSRRDPFVAALLECSRDSGAGDRQGRVYKKLGRSIQQLSCKRACGISDSIVYLPRPRRLTYYDMLNKGSG